MVSLPHRSDDAIRLNADLIGRVRYINIEPWMPEELREIPQKGFDLLEVDIPSHFLDLLVRESITSPQLMQQNCRNLAFLLEIDENPAIQSIDDEVHFQEAFVETTRDHENYESVVQKLITGPLKGKDKRKQYPVKHGGSLDMYHLLLHALAEDPPCVSINMTDLQKRLANVLQSGQRVPTPLTISNTLSQIQKILHRNGEMFQIVEWRDQKLHILDPYFLFYLRWHRK